MPDLLTSAPVHRYEAVCGYDLDADAAVWGSGDTPEDAMCSAAEIFRTEILIGCDEEPGPYEVTIYDSPVWEEDDNGDARIVSHSGEQTITIKIGIGRVEGAV